jgi:hypothetical protein
MNSVELASAGAMHHGTIEILGNSEKYIANRQGAKATKKKGLNCKEKILAFLASWRFSMNKSEIP